MIFIVEFPKVCRFCFQSWRTVAHLWNPSIAKLADFIRGAALVRLGSVGLIKPDTADQHQQTVHPSPASPLIGPEADTHWCSSPSLPVKHGSKTVRRRFENPLFGEPFWNRFGFVLELVLKSLWYRVGIVLEDPCAVGSTPVQNRFEISSGNRFKSFWNYVAIVLGGLLRNETPRGDFGEGPFLPTFQSNRKCFSHGMPWTRVHPKQSKLSQVKKEMLVVSMMRLQLTQRICYCWSDLPQRKAQVSNSVSILCTRTLSCPTYPFSLSSCCDNRDLCWKPAILGLWGKRSSEVYQQGHLRGP